MGIDITLRDILWLVGAKEEIKLVDHHGETILGKSNVQSEVLKSYYDWGVLRIYSDFGISSHYSIKTWLKIMIVEAKE